jgi:DNA-binding NarL/FixJ family response regulator
MFHAREYRKLDIELVVMVLKSMSKQYDDERYIKKTRTKMNVLLIDDHPLILSAMKNLVGGLEGVQTVQGVETAHEARELLRCRAELDLVLLDLQLGDADGFELLVEMRRDFPALPVVVVSASDRVSDVIRVLDAGAAGFVPKRASNEILFEALHLVISGGIYVPPMPAGTLPESLESTLSDASHAARLRGTVMPSSVFGRDAAASNAEPASTTQGVALETLGLTPRQKDVMRLLLQGATNKIIATELGISVETVKDHVATILRVLDVKSRTQAVLVIKQWQDRGLT